MTKLIHGPTIAASPSLRFIACGECRAEINAKHRWGCPALQRQRDFDEQYVVVHRPGGGHTVYEKPPKPRVFRSRWSGELIYLSPDHTEDGIGP